MAYANPSELTLHASVFLKSRGLKEDFLLTPEGTVNFLESTFCTLPPEAAMEEFIWLTLRLICLNPAQQTPTTYAAAQLAQVALKRIREAAEQAAMEFIADFNGDSEATV